MPLNTPSLQIPDIPSPLPAEISEGPSAVREAAALANDIDLSKRRALNAFNDLGRADKKEEHVHRLIIGGVYLVAICCAVMLTVLVLQFVLPTKYKFLSTDDTNRLISFLFSGGIGSLLTAGAKKLRRSETGEVKP